MKIGIIGSGTVGQHLGLGFLKSGHEVMIGTRSPEKLGDWKKQAGEKASAGSFAEAAKFGEILVLATRWQDDATRKAIQMAGSMNFAGKVVIDVTNPLEFGTQGEAPKLAVAYPDSAGKLVQGWVQDAKVVKAFNIITATRMANPHLQEGTADLFIAGDDRGAKEAVAKIASDWGWPVTDMGGISQAYLLEALAMIWICYGFANKTWSHGFKLLRK
jgi:predicted dinucleotide-binding enzyme